MKRFLILFLLFVPLLGLSQTSPTPQQAAVNKNYNSSQAWQVKDWPEGNRIWMTPAERAQLARFADSLVALRRDIAKGGGNVTYSSLPGKPTYYPSSISLVQSLQDALDAKASASALLLQQSKIDTLVGKNVLNIRLSLRDDAINNLQNATNLSILNLNNSVNNLSNRADTLIGVGRGRRLFKGSENVTIDPIDGTIRATAPGSVTLADVNSTPGTFGSETTVPRTTFDSKGRATAVQNTPITLPGKAGAMRLTQLRGQVVAQRTIFLTDKLRGGTFVLDSTDFSSSDDGALVIVDGAGNRYKRHIPDGRLTPQMFGAVGDSLTDDAVALSAWLNATTTYSWYLPAGKYRSSTALARTNKGAFALSTAGSGKVKLCFSGDTDGLSIVNPLNGVYGKIEVSGLTIESVSAKSAGRLAMTVTSQNEQQPGADVNDVSIIGRAGKEWTDDLIFRDCSGIRVDKIYFEGGGINTTTGLVLVNNPSRPMVNLEFGKIYGRALKLGVRVTGTGTPAVEGVSWAQLKLVGVRRGIYAISNDYTAPLLDLAGAHIDAYEQCLYTKNFSQINFGANSLFYITPLSGVTPDTVAVRMDNPQTVTGLLTLNLMAPVKYGVYAGGSGSGIDMGLAVVCRYGESNGVYVEQGVGTTRWRILRSWGGLGSNTGTALIDKSNQAVLDGIPIEDANVSVVRTIFGAGVLDGNTLQAQHVLIPGSEAGKTINTILHRYSGQIITLMTDAQVTIHHAPGSIFLSAQQDMILPYKSRMTLLRTAQGQWEEIATVLPTTPTSATVDQSKNVQGISAKSRADYTTTANQDRPSGFATINSSTGMPIDPTGFNLWLTTTNRYEDGTGNPSYWLSQITANLKSGFLFNRSYDGQTGSYSGWKAIHDNRWFPVDTAMVPAVGNLLRYNGTKWTAAAPVVYDGSETKVVQGSGVSVTGTGTASNPYSISVATASKAVSYNMQTGTAYTLTEADNGKLIVLTNASAITLTLPAGLSTGWNCLIEQGGAGAVTWTNASGVSNYVYPTSTVRTNGKGSRVALDQRGSNVYYLNGQTN